MLNCAVTCRSTDKKPCDNKLSLVTPKLANDFNELCGGAIMKDSMNNLTSLTSVLEESIGSTRSAFADVTSDFATKALGRYLPLCRVTGTDHRVNSTKVLPGLR